MLVTYSTEDAMTSVDIWCPMFHKEPLFYYEEETQTNTDWFYVCEIRVATEYTGFLP